jgi:hypothetical protein
MNVTHIMNYDILRNLPTDNSHISKSEEEILDILFKEKKLTLKSIIKEFYEPLLVGILYIIISTNQATTIVNYFAPITQNSYIFLTVIKMILLMIIFWFLKYFDLSRP